MSPKAREWDADTYDAVSDPQYSWGIEVLERLRLSGEEVAVDAGCGSGRGSAELAQRLPPGRLIAGDRSGAMIAQALAAPPPNRGRRLRGDDRQGAGAPRRGDDLRRRRSLRPPAGRAGRPDLL